MTGTAAHIHYRGRWGGQVLAEVLVNYMGTDAAAQRAVMTIDKPVG
jgi:hypothetical protein